MKYYIWSRETRSIIANIEAIYEMLIIRLYWAKSFT